ncbi:hypothetical protein AAW14_33065 [Streptomyces hygroscopicus]|nr:hypothetical protein [Streptomyces hygroscopicus]
MVKPAQIAFFFESSANLKCKLFLVSTNGFMIVLFIPESDAHFMRGARKKRFDPENARATYILLGQQVDPTDHSNDLGALILGEFDGSPT